MKYLEKKGSTIPSLMNSTGQMATSGSDKANMLNEFFSQCFNQSFSPLAKEDEQFKSSSSSVHHCPSYLLCDEDMVLDFLLSLDSSKRVVLIALIFC